ncbi:hypothetical protein NDU88_003169 [Pleurodeles waltl]|uniref:Uncharacterized protein n=1 Tax=Pleurodeles waltl TaxID=8319 RepID=A0AAV7WS09_PLEWA|nr:hypothetical protein NDU88_003169 [Pleurodeles waltl]
MAGDRQPCGLRSRSFPSLPLTSLCCRQKQKKRPENTPDLGSALGRGDASAARESETGLRGGPWRRGEPRLGTEKAGILRGAQKAARNRTSSRSELMNPA